jgi:hypothetical protein
MLPENETWCQNPFYRMFPQSVSDFRAKACSNSEGSQRSLRILKDARRRKSADIAI